MSDFGNALHKLWPLSDEKIPGLRAGMIASAPAVFAKYGITSPLLVAHVMAQGSHECGAGHEVGKGLSYSAARMTQVWPSRASRPQAAPEPMTDTISGARAFRRQRGVTNMNGSETSPILISSIAPNC
jgi:putative chitinase